MTHDESRRQAPVILDWFLPLTGDSRTDISLGSATNNDPLHRPLAQRPADISYLSQIARAAEHLGYEAVLVPAGSGNEESWTAATALTQHTRTLDYLIAVRPGLVSPTLQAQIAATFQNISGGRLRVNVVVGGEDVEQRRFGDHVGHDDRYRRAAEYLGILRRLWAGERVTHEGEFFQLEDAYITPPAAAPPIYLGGSSDAAIEVAVEHADVYLTWGEPPTQAAQKIARVRDRAAERGRTLRYGIRLHVIARPTSDEAWAIADALVADIDPEQLARRRAALAGSQSVGQQRQTALTNGGTARTDLQIHPGLWAGVSLVRGGAGTALVGSYQEVAGLIEEYYEHGFSEFVLSGYPHLEEAYWFAEGVRPELARRGLL
ncbi:LLM class flavin-dependent oxidoreductase [Microbacterium allomyrinae]|uniref:LLM class flavin-dependent oxidoreductase n=1 Tax=Microbacterium allomyrinae TaxID=2830666 RepID=A0A9X1LY92_9MICO|nr:LLM class flavin-dependent oxidoreductase [Microbacterium allomyrinae]MCC2033933.1 LLM class flavin-dependent oxidoreductase [Microbacterium allomyrinae]